MFDVVLLTLLVTFAGLRVGVGTDYYGYADRFSMLRGTSLSHLPDTGQETGFVVFQVLLHQITANPQILFFATALLAIVPLYVGVRRHRVAMAVAIPYLVLFGTYLSSFNVMRQSIAVALVFAATTLLPRKKTALALVVIAVSFHISAVLVLPFIALVLWRRPNPRTALVGALAGGLILTVLMRWNVLQSAVARLNPRYETYASASSEAGLGAALLLIAFAGLFLFAMAQGVAENERVWFGLAAVGVVFLAAGTQDVVVGRMGMYFAPFLGLSLGAQALRLGRSGAFSGIAVVLSGFIYYSLHLANFGGLIPYQWTLDLL